MKHVKKFNENFYKTNEFYYEGDKETVFIDIIGKPKEKNYLKDIIVSGVKDIISNIQGNIKLSVDGVIKEYYGGTPGESVTIKIYSEEKNEFYYENTIDENSTKGALLSEVKKLIGYLGGEISLFVDGKEIDLQR